MSSPDKLSLQLKKLYNCKCPDCGGRIEKLVLSKNDNDKLEKAFNKAVRWIFRNKKTDITTDDLNHKNTQPLLNEINTLLQEGMNKGITHHIPDVMMRNLRENVFVFSGAKTYAELKELSNLLLDEKRHIKPFHQFWKDTQAIHKEYNGAYLESEYLFSIQSAKMADKWNEYQQDGDRYNLQYRTANDDRVRESHWMLHDTTLPTDDPFWDKYMPPNGWRCRCTVVQVRKKTYAESDSEKASELGNEATGGKNKLFRFNPGKQQVIFPEHHPYFKELGEQGMEAVKKMENVKPGNKSINLSDFIKGNEPTNQEVKNIISAYADKNPDDFSNGLEKVDIRKAKSYLMQHSIYGNEKKGEWIGKSTISISTNDFGTFNPAKELKDALAAIKKGDALTFNQEYAIEALWHEILHAKTKTKPYQLTSIQRARMETANQFVARHTYPDFITRLGGKASNQKEILDNGYGYKKMISDFRNRLKEAGIKETDAVKKLQPVLFENYIKVGDELVNLVKKNN